MTSKFYTFDTAVKYILDNFAKDINISLPAKIVKFDSKTQQATVQPAIKAVIENEDSSEPMFDRMGDKFQAEHVDMPVIEKVPVQYTRAGNFMFTVPIKAGDTGYLVFPQRDISRWIKEGGVAKQADLNLFDYSNAFFTPFIANETNAISDYNESALEIRGEGDKIILDGNDITIKPLSGNTKINDATDNAVLFSELKIVYDKAIADIQIELDKKLQVPATAPIPLVSDLTPAKDDDLLI